MVYWLPLSALRILVRVLRGQVDVVLFSSMVTASLAIFLRPLAKRLPVQFVAIAHGRDVTLPGLYQSYIVRKILRSLDAVLPVSAATGTQLQSRGMPAERIHVIPNGVDLGRFPQPYVGGRESHRPFVLCSVGRLVERKGFVWFVDQVMPHLPANIHYRVAGFGPEQTQLEAAILRGGLGNRVTLMGRCTDNEIQDLYLASDLLVMPNIPVKGDMEGFGVVILESGACGTPAIVANMEGMRDVVTDGVNGHLCTAADLDAFVSAITRYSSRPATLQTLRESTARHTADVFSWGTVAERYVSVLRRFR